MRRLHPILRAAILIPIVGSVIVHAGAWWGLLHIPVRRAPRLTDAPAPPPPETVLTLNTPAPAPKVEPPPPEIKPAPPPPEPKPEPKPEPPPQPVEIAPLKVETPIPAPAPAPVITAPAPKPTPTPAPVTPIAEPQPEPAPASFAGVQGPRASRIVYVVDSSGSMTSSLPFVLAELDRSVSRLNASQSFQVIVYHDPPRGSHGAPLEVFDQRADTHTLVAANDENKQRLRSWLAGVQPSGRSDPREALVTALSLKPELIFLLTRSIKRSGPDASWAGGNRAMLETLDRLNPVDTRSRMRPVIIKTIQFVDDDPTGLLKSIAAAHGDGEGSYRVMRLEEMPGHEPEPLDRR